MEPKVESSIELIESGGYGSIYRKKISDPKDSKKEKVVAIKRMDLDKEVPFYASLKEVNTLRVFRHPHLVTFQKVRVINPKRKSVKISSYFVEVEMDFWDNDLHRLMKRAFSNGMSVNSSLKILSQVISGLSFLHSNGIYHLDLKPANILVNVRGHPKNLEGDVRDIKDIKNTKDSIENPDEILTVAICDFGCGTYHPFDNVINIGTVNCRPPENFVHLAKGSLLKKINDVAGEGCNYSAETDVWACGALLIFLLTGKNLLFPEGDFNYEFPEKRIEQFINNPEKYILFFLDPVLDNAKVKLEIKKKLVSLILSMVALNPKERPSLITISKNELFKGYEKYLQIEGSIFKPLYMNIDIPKDKHNEFIQIVLGSMSFLTSSNCCYQTGYTAIDLAIRLLISQKKFDLLDLSACVRIAFIFFEDHEEDAYGICNKKFTMNLIDLRCLQITELLKGYLVVNSPFIRCNTIEDFDSLMIAYLKIKDYFNWKPKGTSQESLKNKTWAEVFTKSKFYLDGIKKP